MQFQVSLMLDSIQILLKMLLKMNLLIGLLMKLQRKLINAKLLRIILMVSLIQNHMYAWKKQSSLSKLLEKEKQKKQLKEEWMILKTLDWLEFATRLLKKLHLILESMFKDILMVNLKSGEVLMMLRAMLCKVILFNISEMIIFDFN